MEDAKVTAESAEASDDVMNLEVCHDCYWLLFFI